MGHAIHNQAPPPAVTPRGHLVHQARVLANVAALIDSAIMLLPVGDNDALRGTLRQSLDIAKHDHDAVRERLGLEPLGEGRS